jgi:hypothetical protein
MSRPVMGASIAGADRPDHRPAIILSVHDRPRLPGRRTLAAGAVAVLVVGLVRAWDDSRQVSSGDGWQLLVRQRAVGERGRVTLIGDQAALEAAWK